MNRPPSLSIILAFGVLACGEPTAPLTPADFVGRYPLTSVNGQTVPQTIPAASGCTRSFQCGTLNLGDGAFVLDLYGTSGGCPGGGVYPTLGIRTFGGDVTVRGRTLILRAVDGDGAPRATVQLEATLSGAEIQLTLPPGTMDVAGLTILTFGPGQSTP